MYELENLAHGAFKAEITIVAHFVLVFIKKKVSSLFLVLICFYSFVFDF